MGEIPSSFPELEGMQLEQLERLQKDDIAFKTFFEGIEAVQTTRRLQEQLLEQNADIANENLTHQEELEALHAEATTDASVISQVSEAARRAEETSEEITSQFMDGQLGVTPFLKAFIEKRAEFHRWTSKAEFAGRR